MAEILINNSLLTQRARDYADLSDLAYADWRYNQNNMEWVPESKYISLWNELFIKGYRVLSYKPNESSTGYSGILFEGPADSNGMRRRILVNRGSTPFADAQDMKAVLQLSNGEMPAAQFCAMNKFRKNFGDAPHICRFAF